MTTFADTLARFALETPTETLQSDVVEVLRLSVLDWLAVGYAGRAEPVSQILRAQVEAESGAPEATLFGGAERVPARAAALANGTISHALDYDDTHFDHIGHPSVAVLPAVFALAEKTGASGADLQAAALIGMEASIRVGVWLGRDHYQTGFHQTATAGAAGATLAAARMLGLSHAATVMALGLAATRASGLKSQFGTMGKPFNAGMAASNGVEAALLASRGMDSTALGWNGPQGFGETHAGAGELSAFDGLGETWRFERISHKLHACCHGLHAALEALQELLPIDAAQVTEIAVQTHPRWLKVCNQPAPDTGLGAKFSYTTALALRMLGHDTADLATFTDALANDAEVGTLRQRVRVDADASLVETAATLTVTLRDGTRRIARHDLMDIDPPDTRARKVRAKAAVLLGEARATEIWDLLGADSSADALWKALD